MDPWIERAEIWRDFHSRLITRICEDLQPLLRPRYVITTEDRIYVEEPPRDVGPDATIIKLRHQEQAASAIRSTALADPAVEFDVAPVEIRERVLQVLDPNNNDRIVTSIEVLSPTNKRRGAGRKSYLQKRRELWRGGVNIVEIDLLRRGAWTVMLSPSAVSQMPPGVYQVVVSRRSNHKAFAYRFGLRERLPRILIPLLPSDEDVVLNLQAALEHVWEFGPYPARLLYDQRRPPALSDEDLAWCHDRLRAAGLLA